MPAVDRLTRQAPSRRKWIDARIEQLDPETDYVEIVRLSTLYNLDELQMHWFYTVGTAAAALAPAVCEAVYRNGTGTYVVQPERRRDDSNDHMMLWFEHGPEAPATKRSVGMVNKYHAHFAKTHPEGFADADDYIYVLTMNATLVHRAQTSLGLPGFSAKQKRAVYLFWSKLAQQFTTPEGRPVTDVTPFPEDFDAMETFVREYQARPWPMHQAGHHSTSSGIEHFATRWFPRPLQFFGRALVTAFLPPSVARAHAIEPPPAALAWTARRVMKTMMQLAAHVLPDGKQTLPDRRRRLADQGKGSRSGVDTAVHRSLGPARPAAGSAAPASACPHLAALG